MGNNVGSNVGRSIEAGLLTMFGLNGVDQSDPVAQKSAELSNLNSQIASLTQKSNLILLNTEQDEIKNLHQVITQNIEYLEDVSAYNNELLWESMSQTNLSLIVVFVILIFFLIYFLLTPTKTDV